MQKASRQEVRRRQYSQTGTQAKKHERQTAGARNVQAGGKYCERDKKADRCHEAREKKNSQEFV